MPSFFEGMKRIIQGKPVFEPGDSTGATTQSSSDNVSSQPPRVQIERTDSRLNGDRMETYCDIRNFSDSEVFLDKIRLLGDRREVDATLRAGDRKQFLVYAGKAPSDASEHDAELQYRDMDGNYFKARYDVRFERHNDDMYTIEDFRYENTSRI